MTEKLILALDQGTTSSRAIIFDLQGRIRAMRQKELALAYPQKGWVEQDPMDIWADTRNMANEAVASLGNDGAAQVTCIGITNQRETTVIWERESGKPVYPAIVWQDRRTAAACRTLKQDGHEETIRQKTGLLLDPYFSATKIAWILDNVDGARAKAAQGKLAFGTVDSWLLWHLTEGKTHATDITNASRTLLWNIETQSWDQELLALFNVPESLLPEIKENAAPFGETGLFTDHTLPISGVAGDQQAALFGQACFTPGMIKATYGTGCFALINTGGTPKRSQHRLLTTPAYKIGGQTTYALEGSIFVAGAAIQWLRDQMGLFKDAADSEKIARTVSDSNGVVFIPAFTGLGAPYWNPDVKAAITGLSRESNSAHIVRAALEAQAYQTHDLVTAFAADMGGRPAVIRADGGLTTNRFVCQFIADILDIKLELPRVTETTALGAAYLAGLQEGLYGSLDEISSQWEVHQSYEPDMSGAERNRLLGNWKDAIKRLTAL